MALVACSECGNQISTAAKSCPKCGAPNEPQKHWAADMASPFVPDPARAKPKSPHVPVRAVIVGALLLWIFISLGLNNSTETSSPTAPPETKLDARTLATKLQQRMDEKNWPAARAVGEQMIMDHPNDPLSARAKDVLLPFIQARQVEAQTRLAETKLKAGEARRAKVKAAVSGLRRERDEVNGITFYKAPEVSMTSVANYWGLYLGLPDNGPPYLRFMFMYTAEDWLFIRGITLNVDGQKLPDVPLNWGQVERDNGGGRIWEWYDESVDDDMIPLFERLIRSKKTIIRYEGTQYRKDKILSALEKEGMRKILTAYAALKAT